MANMVGPNESLEQIIEDVNARSLKQAAAASVFKLFKNDVTPGAGTKATDLIEADFTGYALAPVTAWTPPQIDPVTGLPYLLPLTPSPVQWTQTGVAITNTVFGFWLEVTPGVILLAQRFETPLPMDTMGKVVTILPKVFAQALTGPDALED